MQTTDKLDLKMTTTLTYDSDDIKETIVEYGSNFEKIENTLADSIEDISDLALGRYYNHGKKLWNEFPQLGEYIGWVNLREGFHALEWQPLKKYSLGNTIRANPDNGNIYECISDGRTMNRIPTFLMSNGVEFNDANGNSWTPQRNYEVDDVAFPVDGGKLFYYICETAGLSSTTEPDWDSIATGVTLIDGSVVWRKEKTVRWKQIDTSCNFRPFGKIE